MMLPNNTADFLLAGKPPDRVALRLLDGDFTYGDLSDASSEFASRLVNNGAAQGDRVIMLSGNSFHWVAAYLGILRAGMVCVPLPGTLSAQDLAYMVVHTEARLAFVQNQIAMKHAPTLAQFGVTMFRESENRASCYFEGTVSVKPQSPTVFPEVASSDLAALMFTSGSTGTPRGVMVSHRNIMANTNSIIEALSLQENDRMMVVLPFHYCFGTSLLHTYLRVGAMLVIDPRFMYPEVVVQQIQETECTSFAGVPSHYQILLRNSSLTKRSFPRLHSLLQPGVHLAVSLLQELQRTLPQTRIFVMYGQTEATARLSCLPPEALASKLGSIGKAIPGVTLHVITESGCDAAPGEIGEIVAEGDNITRGYWRAPEETANTFRDGRLYTGDLAKVDEDGFLYVVDRAKEFIKCGGIRTSCRQIEDSLLEYADLLEVAVVGVPDDVLGEAVRAFVVPRSSERDRFEERLRQFCKAKLARSFYPRDVVVVNTLPKNSSGKVLRAQLKNVKIGAH